MEENNVRDEELFNKVIKLTEWFYGRSTFWFSRGGVKAFKLKIDVKI